MVWMRALVATMQVPGRPKYDSSTGVRTRRQVAAHGSGVSRSPTPLPARLMHAVVQLLQQAAAPPDDTANWRELLYGEYSDSGDDGERDGAAGDGAAQRLAVGDDVRALLPAVPCRAVLCLASESHPDPAPGQSIALLDSYFIAVSVASHTRGWVA